MAQNLTINGVTYNGVESLSIPKSGGGNAVFTEGGGGTPTPVARKDVNFYDYDGTCLYAYTLAEAQALSALPTQPTHTGLTGQGWNYTLAEVNALTRKCNVGAMYITDDGKTRLYINIEDIKRNIVPLYFSQTVSYGVTIDWGDGGATQTVVGTGNKTISHTYMAAGEYVIALNPVSGCTLGLGNNSSSAVVIGGSNSGYRNMLRRAEIGLGVTSILESTFYYCYSLASINIPNNVTSIGYNAFNSCYSLTSIIIPNNVTSILNYTFYNCCSLASINIPNNVTSIGDYAFYGCCSLASINIPNNVTSSLDHTFYNCYSLASIIIPNNVTSIERDAFNSCSSLASIIIPNNVTSIGTYAFSNCAFVREYHVLPATPPTLGGTNAFNGIPSDCKIYVPSASLTAYKTATNWSSQAAKMVGE